MTYKNNFKIAVIGLGYVGLPLAIELSNEYDVVGFDINSDRVKEIKNGIDITKELDKEKILNSKKFIATDLVSKITNLDIYIITVPTPITIENEPDLSNLVEAAKIVGKSIKKESIVVIESTVYPGITEDFIQPIIAESSGLIPKKDFNMGYSPERVNPGDKIHTVDKIVKVVAGDNIKTTKLLAEIYRKIIKAGIFEATSIRVAEASKAIENAQRDINIAFINEVAMICKKLKINSLDVLNAAKTKWNFLDFSPGLVGGHCIGVDPYYLAKSAIDVGHQPEMILAGRKINDGMPKFIFKQIKIKISKNIRILFLGLTFKENVRDLRNSKSADLAKLLIEDGYILDIYDPQVEHQRARNEYKINIKKPNGKYGCVVIAVPHKEFFNMSKTEVLSILEKDALLVDIKGIWKNLDLPKSIKRWNL